MRLTLREAATLLGRSERTVRAQLSRGELTGVKVDGRWAVERDHLPLTEAQRATLQARADEIRAVVEAALPGRLAVNARDRRRSAVDLVAFTRGQQLLAAIDATAPLDAEMTYARRAVRAAVADLAVAFHEFDGRARLVALSRARAGLAEAVAAIAVAGGVPCAEPRATWIRRLEQDVIPPLSGMFRRAERVTPRREWA